MEKNEQVDGSSQAAGQPNEQRSPRLLCGKCGGDQIQSTAWVVHNTGEIVQSEGPTDDIWCPDCDEDCSYDTVYDSGFGFELWIAGEYDGCRIGYAEALVDARASGKPFSIVPLTRVNMRDVNK